MPGPERQFDHIVVGGGTAGAVIAARLSEDQQRRVLLLEAGPDYPDAVPPRLLDASFAVMSGHNWDMRAIVRPTAVAGQRARIGRVFELASSFLLPSSFLYPLGKVMGGGSAVNGGLALHARPEDYASWSAAGCDEWNWERVSPYINRIAGPDPHKPALPVETPLSGDLTPCQRAFLETYWAMGSREVDLCHGTIEGVGTIPKCLRQGQRFSTSALYLAAARGRSNLIIRSNCLVDKLILENGSGPLVATGVEALIDGLRCRFSGEHVTICAGAINSPAILQRSGIGAEEDLRRSNIKPVLDLPGVGKNLQDHPSVCLWATPKRGACVAGEPVHQMMAQHRSSRSGPLCDIQLFMLSAVPTQEIPVLRQIIGSDLAMGISVVLATPLSRGHVKVVNDDVATQPQIHLNCLQEAEDLRRMMEGVELAWRILGRAPLHLHIDRTLVWTQDVMTSNTLRESLVRAMVRGTWHPVGTLRMGKADDPMTVVDQRGRLHGCRNVTAADASIMPAIPSVPTCLTCMLIGERVAAHLRSQEA